MIRYIKMKKMEIEIKMTLYGYVLGVLHEKKEIMELGKKLYETLRESSPEDIKESFINAIAELAHEQAAKEKKDKIME